MFRKQDEVPQELSEIIASYLDAKSLGRVFQVSREWKQISDEKAFWQIICKERKIFLPKDVDSKLIFIKEMKAIPRQICWYRNAIKFFDKRVEASLMDEAKQSGGDTEMVYHQKRAYYYNHVLGRNLLGEFPRVVEGETDDMNGPYNIFRGLFGGIGYLAGVVVTKCEETLNYCRNR